MCPVIFDDVARNNIKSSMLENGFVSIREKGLKNTAIEDIAKQSGIAKGTFYNFFKSKEDFVVSIIEYKNNQIMSNIQKYCKHKAFISREEVFNLVEYLFSNENENLYSYLSFEEIRQVIKKQPNFVAPDEYAKKTIDYFLSLIPNHNKNCDWKVLINYSRMISIIKNFDDTKSFYQDVLDKNISAIIGLIVDEVIGISKI
ncbi:TetR/AcrR family transcriptional regulator [Candidatus Stoquefichus massiliensis]|uniref:TetR/AcrR family transcriptional regulator n=1 Tax=Candidatus Stoquefichus massiliensis TaxID=1470350 RepID=UPI0004859119|nr:TetR/AcrR family transcriptional regulator [Candidatus Stoquefichus massiliensis]